MLFQAIRFVVIVIAVLGDGYTGKSGMLQSMGSQSVGHNLVTEQQQIVLGERETELNPIHK